MKIKLIKIDYRHQQKIQFCHEIDNILFYRKSVLNEKQKCLLARLTQRKGIQDRNIMALKQSLFSYFCSSGGLESGKTSL